MPLSRSHPSVAEYSLGIGDNKEEFRMGSFKFGFKIGKGEVAKIRIKIDFSGNPGQTPPEPEYLRPTHNVLAAGTTLPLPFPGLAGEPERIAKAGVSQSEPGFWQRIFSHFQAR